MGAVPRAFLPALETLHFVTDGLYVYDVNQRTLKMARGPVLYVLEVLTLFFIVLPVQEVDTKVTISDG